MVSFISNLVARSNQDMWTFQNMVKQYYDNVTIDSLDNNSIITVEDKQEKYQITVNTNMDNFKIGDVIQHFKGPMYKIIGECTDANTSEDMFIYIALSTPFNIFCRPKKEFYDIVDIKKNYLLKQIYRFIKVG